MTITELPKRLQPHAKRMVEAAKVDPEHPNLNGPWGIWFGCVNKRYLIEGEEVST
jgi:hypothetical protein